MDGGKPVAAGSHGPQRGEQVVVGRELVIFHAQNSDHQAPRNFLTRRPVETMQFSCQPGGADG
jgi:hypothetical protein